MGGWWTKIFLQITITSTARNSLNKNAHPSHSGNLNLKLFLTKFSLSPHFQFLGVVIIRAGYPLRKTGSALLSKYATGSLETYTSARRSSVLLRVSSASYPFIIITPCSAPRSASKNHCKTCTNLYPYLPYSIVTPYWGMLRALDLQP